MKTNYLFSTLLSLALASPGMAQETNYQRPPAVIEEVALAKLSPIIRISDNNQWALQLERSPYRSIAKLAQPELKLAGMRISPETFNTSRQAEYTGASLMNIATQEEIKIEGIPDNAVITEASFSPSSNKVDNIHEIGLVLLRISFILRFRPVNGSRLIRSPSELAGIRRGRVISHRNIDGWIIR